LCHSPELKGDTAAAKGGPIKSKTWKPKSTFGRVDKSKRGTDGL